MPGQIVAGGTTEAAQATAPGVTHPRTLADHFIEQPWQPDRSSHANAALASWIRRQGMKCSVLIYY